MMLKKVYLAGGFRSGWQEKVKEACKTKARNSEAFLMWGDPPMFNWEDPFAKERGEFAEERVWTAKEYTKLDLFMIDQSDVVFCYLEKDNPGLGLIAECGYAIGKGKAVILVRETPHEVHTDRYLDFLEEMCTITFDKLEDGITFLKTFA
jgi:nucleoside 2-deoxyribosyltransferase